jgi:predicted CopG family antitoxin
MGTRNIAISEEAYERLKYLKKPGESFTELIERMTRRRSVADLAGLLTRSEGPEVKKRVSELRKASSRRLSEVEAEMS